MSVSVQVQYTRGVQRTSVGVCSCLYQVGPGIQTQVVKLAEPLLVVQSGLLVNWNFVLNTLVLNYRNKF